MCRATVLYVSSSTSLYSGLKECLQEDNIEAKHCYTVPELIHEHIESSPDLVLIECADQGINELALCGDICEMYTGPLVLIADQDNVKFKIMALKLGVDISLSKSDGAQLVAANIQALLRRLRLSFHQSLLDFGNLIIDARRRDAFLAGERINLSTIEFEVLWVVARKSGFVVSRDEIHHELYGATYNGYDRNIDLYISRIRKKIGDDPCSPVFLKTVRGIGYQFILSRDAQTEESR